MVHVAAGTNPDGTNFTGSGHVGFPAKPRWLRPGVSDFYPVIGQGFG